MATTTDDRDFLRVDNEAFGACPSESIDYAVMENTDRAVVVPLDVGWDDIGAWSALWDTAQKDDVRQRRGRRPGQCAAGVEPRQLHTAPQPVRRYGRGGPTW